MSREMMHVHPSFKKKIRDMSRQLEGITNRKVSDVRATELISSNIPIVVVRDKRKKEKSKTYI